MKIKHCIVLLLALACSFAEAQWVRTHGPYGGWVRSLAVSGTTIYAGMGSIVGRAGVYRSTDNGNHWVNLLPGDGPLPPHRGYECWALHARGNTVLAGPNMLGIYRSTDQGTTWSVANSGLTNLEVRSLESVGDFFFAGTWGGLFRSSDDGQSWIALDSIFATWGVHDLACSDSIVFAGRLPGVYRSTDYGASWYSASWGLPELRPDALTAAPNGTGGMIVYAAYAGNLYRSEDSGATWAACPLSVWGSIEALEASGTTLFAGNWVSLFRSIDFGATWTQLDSLMPNHDVIALTSFSNGDGGRTVFAGTVPFVRIHRQGNNVLH